MFNASVYQQNIFNWVVEGTGSCLVEATAGSGKTTTLVESIKLMAGSILFVAFSKKIQLEIESRLAKLGKSGAFTSTFHAAGFASIRRYRRNIKVDADKVSKIVDNMIHEDENIKFVASFIKRIVALAKDSAFGVEGQADIDDVDAWLELANHHDLSVEEGEIDIEMAIDMAMFALKESNNDNESIDYADMIYHVLLFDLDAIQYDWLLIDEAQDTNVSRRLLAGKMLKDGGRLMAVGDDWQSIMGFTGADNEAMNNIADMFNCVRFPLSICYRCAKSIVIEAQKVNPTIEAFEGNEEGTLSSLSYDEFITKIPDYNLTGYDGIICRNNAPLVPLAFSLIRKGISCRIEGKDIGNQLAQYTYKWKDRGVVEFNERFNNFMDKEIEKALAKKNNAHVANLEDKKDTMNALVARCLELNQTDVISLRNLILSMFSDSDGKLRRDIVTLCSVHKSKGLEFERVFSLGKSQFMPSPYATLPWMVLQESHLAFVLLTRAKSEFVDIYDVPSATKRKENA